MKISVIIPIYNVAAYIERCLLSALNQTWADIEIILVDDCTPDNSMEIVEKVLASHTDRIVKIVRHEKNRGLSAARNTGIKIANGDYVYFLDSDDYLSLSCIETLAQAASETLVDFVIGNYEIVGPYRNLPALKLPTGKLAGNQSILSTFTKGKWYVMAWNKLVKRDFLLKENLFFQEGIVHEDDLWSFLLACKSQTAYVVNRVTYYYYIQPNSITGTPSLRNLECRVFIIQYLYDFIRSSMELKENRYVYKLFELMKFKYFDRILYFTKDETFRKNSYETFRSCRYISPAKALFKFRPGLFLSIGNIYCLLPGRIGYIYLKSYVSLSYYSLIFKIKLKRFIKRTE